MTKDTFNELKNFIKNNAVGTRRYDINCDCYEINKMIYRIYKNGDESIKINNTLWTLGNLANSVDEIKIEFNLNNS